MPTLKGRLCLINIDEGGSQFSRLRHVSIRFVPLARTQDRGPLSRDYPRNRSPACLINIDEGGSQFSRLRRVAIRFVPLARTQDRGPLFRDYPRNRSPAGLSALEPEDLDTGSCSTTTKVGRPQGFLPRKPTIGARVVVRVVVAF